MRTYGRRRWRPSQEKFGLSASALTNVCRKHNIPVPSVGHWTKIEVGHKITAPPLIPESSGRENVDIHGRERISPELAALAAETSPKVEIPKLPSRVEDGKAPGMRQRE